MRTIGRQAMRAALITGAVALLVGVAVDRWYVREMQVMERERVRERIIPYADALRSAIDRRLGVLTGLYAFVSTRRTRADLESEFSLFARGAAASVSGVRALQYFDDGRVARIEPIERNREAMGLDLARDPRPQVRADYARAMRSLGPTVTGPVPLVEGGSGILLRQRLETRSGFPDLVTVVLDAPSIVADAGIPDRSADLRLAVLSARGTRMGGDSIAAAEDPVVVSVAFEGDTWTLQGVPDSGWTSAVRDWHWEFRAVVLLFVLVVSLVALVLADRFDRLARERERSDSTLRVAMRAGGIGAWSLELATDRLETSGATLNLLGEAALGAGDPIAPALALLPAEDRAHVQRLCAEARAGRRDTFATEVRAVRAGAPVRSLVCLGQLVRDPSGNPYQLVGILSDVTERRALEERLRQYERLESVGKLAGGVAHDFNNLLTAIAGFAELARGHASSLTGAAAEAIADDLRQVQESTRAGAQLTAQLLAFSRRSPTAPSRLDLATALLDLQPILVRLFGQLLHDRIEIASGLPAVRAEPGMLTQVLLSLLVRARDALPGPALVRLRAFHVPAAAADRPPGAPIGEWVCLELVEEGHRAEESSAPTRRATPAAGIQLHVEPEVSAVGFAVIASGLESAGSRLDTLTREDGAQVTRLFVPPWREPI
jgi:sensor domain CHASE-containing protein